MYFSWDFYRRLSVHSPTGSNNCHVVWISVKFGEAIIKEFVYKKMFGFSFILPLLPFYEAFDISVKNKKNSGGKKVKFQKQSTKWKKIWRPFIKHLICEH